jgi:predicted helicase
MPVTTIEEVIAAYITACTQEQNLNTFEKLARNFWYHTAADGYDALYTSRELFSENPEKMAIIENVAKESDTDLEIKF